MAQGTSLTHYGVKGMKWGRRKARVASSGNKRARLKSTFRRRRKRQEVKDVSQMSNQELQEYINRKNLENQYKRLSRSGSDDFHDVMKQHKRRIMALPGEIAIDALKGVASRQAQSYANAYVDGLKKKKR